MDPTAHSMKGCIINLRNAQMQDTRNRRTTLDPSIMLVYHTSLLLIIHGGDSHHLSITPSPTTRLRINSSGGVFMHKGNFNHSSSQLQILEPMVSDPRPPSQPDPVRVTFSQSK